MHIFILFYYFGVNDILENKFGWVLTLFTIFE